MMEKKGPCTWVHSYRVEPTLDELKTALVDVTMERDQLHDELIDERAEHEVTRGLLFALEARVAREQVDQWVEDTEPGSNLAAELASIAAGLNECELMVLVTCGRKLSGEGRREHGAMNLATDKRDLQRECLDESADGLVYACMRLVQLMQMGGV